MLKRAQENIDQLARNLGTGDAKVAVLKQGLIQQKVMDLEKDLRDLNARLRAEEAVHQMILDQGMPADAATVDSLLGRVPAIGGADALPGGGVINPQAANFARELADIRYRIAEFQATCVIPIIRSAGLKRQEARLLSMMTGVPTAPTGNGTPGVASPAPASRLELLKRQRDKLQEEINEQMDLHTSIGQKIVQLEGEQRKVQQDIKTRDELATELSKRRVEMNAPERIKIVQTHMFRNSVKSKKTQMSFLAVQRSSLLLCSGSHCLNGFRIESVQPRMFPGKWDCELWERYRHRIEASVGLGIFAGKWISMNGIEQSLNPWM